jgi:hypothetical protein
MSRFLVAALAGGLLLAPGAAPAQQNPFKVPKGKLRSLEISYAMTGDLTGTSLTAMDGERMMSRSTATGKFFGKTTTTEQWTLMDGDWMYTADLATKKGTRMPNLLPVMAKEWDRLDKDQQKRAWQNMQDLGELMARAFGGGPMTAGNRVGKRTVAGEACEERRFGTFTICTMEKAPQVPLYTSASLLCVRYEQTATAVKVDAAVPASAFAIPGDVTFQTPEEFERPDSLARGFLYYLASEALADSLTRAKAEMEQARATAVKEGNLTPQQADSVSQAQTQAACEAIRNLDVGKVMASAADAAMKAMAEAMKESAKQAVTSKLKGLIRKP